jgi:NAD(P)-dependent dehydrogenase (short-subunit alcohol dehydrogenase family)
MSTTPTSISFRWTFCGEYTPKLQTIAVIGANTGIGQGTVVAIARAGTVIGIGRSPMEETAALEAGKMIDSFTPHRADFL